MKIITLFFILSAINIFTCKTVDTGNSNTGNTATENTAVANNMNNTIRIRGTVQVYGSEPRTYVGIVTEDGVEYSVFPQSHEAELRSLQGRLIDFTVILLDQMQGYGSLFLRGGTVTPVSWEIVH